jgi:molybdopterin molybdotransferase
MPTYTTWSKEMISYDKSIAILHAQTPAHPKSSRRYLNEALGYVLAEEIFADADSPAYPTAAMDGYAYRHSDAASGSLVLAGETPAGSLPSIRLSSGACIKTFTGSLMPEGSDTLIPIEYVTEDQGNITIQEAVSQGHAVRQVGEIYTRGESLISKGTRIGFTEIGIMASLNVVAPLVYEKPVVSIFSTGSELLELGEPQTHAAQIRSANNHILQAIAEKYGGQSLQLGCVADDQATITRTLEGALKQSDLVVTTGGVSVGDYDFMEDVVRSLGCEILFKGVRIKPGQHLLLACREGRYILGLPGFAYSATVTALLYLVPLLGRLQGSKCGLREITATLREPYLGPKAKTAFVACRLLHDEAGGYYVDFAGKKSGSSAILTNMLGDTALMILEENEHQKDAGDSVRILLID